jgi:hypothetical protein
MARDLLKSKQGLFLLPFVCGKVGANSEKEVSIWGGPNIKRDMDMRECYLEFDSYSILMLLPSLLSLDIHY